MTDIITEPAAVAPEVAPPPSSANPVADTAAYQVLVSYYDGSDFDGDWRWSADCPAIGCASDGRTRQEALRMVADAMQCLLADYPPGAHPLQPNDAMTRVQAEYDAAGWPYTLDEVAISSPTLTAGCRTNPPCSVAAPRPKSRH